VLDPKDLLLARQLDAAGVAARLAPYGFRDHERADRNLQSIADQPRARQLLADVLPEVLRCLGESADPDQALNLLERFVRASVNRVELLGYLKTAPRAVEVVAKAFGASPFMAEILIRDPVWLYWVADPGVLDRSAGEADLSRELSRETRGLATEERRLAALRVFKRREILRIGLRDLLRLQSVEETLDALSVLARVLIQKATDLAWQTVEGTRPEPRRDASRPGGFAVIALGKLGGDELNFSSDTDLMYVHADDPDDAVPYDRLARWITAALSQVTPEGYVYRVDLRLRPEGTVGGLAHSLAAATRYYLERAETWERLALLKAQPVAGDHRLGRRLLRAVEPFLYGRPFDEAAVADVRTLKERIDRKVEGRGHSRRDVKLGLGGIREIEFIVQSLQLRHGAAARRLRHRRTMGALAALRAEGILTEKDRRALADAYLFLRDVENKLQMASDAQVHAIPAEPEDLRACARALGYADGADADATARFLADHRRHTENVSSIFQRVFRARGPADVS
jgi:glutamate-ammonia-ligase adenylyltransferase